MLDEIGEMKPALQAKLLHVLQDAEFTKLGSNKRIEVDVRVVAATNRDLEKMMVSGDFREDLYYRLKVIELTVPALRERRDEIPTLTDFFIARYLAKYSRPAPRLSPTSCAAVPDLRVARQHPRAREHDQADGDPPGRAARVRRDRPEHAASRRPCAAARGRRRPRRLPGAAAIAGAADRGAGRAANPRPKARSSRSRPTTAVPWRRSPRRQR